jgi:hypothetical protein
VRLPFRQGLGVQGCWEKASRHGFTPRPSRFEADEAQKRLAPLTESISVHPISAGRSSDYC